MSKDNLIDFSEMDRRRREKKEKEKEELEKQVLKELLKEAEELGDWNPDK